MDSADKYKKGTPGPKLTTPRTRRQSAEAKRKAEEEIKQLKEDKRRREMFAPRKHGRIGSYDLIVDRNLPKICIRPIDQEDVKDEVKSENEDQEGHPNMDGEYELIQLDEEMEEEAGTVEPNLIVEIDKVLPIVLPFLKQKDIFRCRIVSKQWRGVIDEYIEDLIVPRQYDDEAYQKKVKSCLCPLPKFRIVQYAYKFRRERELEKFNEAMKSHIDSGLSPFVGGATVTLKNLFNEYSLLSPATKKFLENFGVYVRRLVIQQGCMRPKIFLECVKKCLRHVPSLERLKIVGDVILDYDNASHWARIYYSEVDEAIVFRRDGRKLVVLDQYQMTNLKLGMYRNEMLDRTPKLEKLEALEFQYLPVDHRDNYWPYLEVILGDVMIKPYYQTQLKTMQLDWANNLLNLEMCNVKELRLVNLRCKLNESDFHSSVEKLTLSKPFSKVYLVDIFHKFPSLRYLSIDTKIHTGSIYNFPENNVHTLEMIDMDNQDYIHIPDFVLPKLRYLILRSSHKKYDDRLGVECSLDRRSDQSVNIKGVKIAHLISGGTSYDSNVWTNLPQLQILTLQFQDHNCSPMCKDVKGTKYECPFKNIIETREGFQRYHERDSSMINKCFTPKNSANGEELQVGTTSSQSNFSKPNLEEEKSGIMELHALPFVLPYLGLKDIFRCRQVDKKWRGMVDDFIEKSIVPLDYDDQAYLEKMEKCPTQPSCLPKFRNVECAYNFNSERILKYFNERMATHVDSGLSPFVGGATVTLDNLFANFPHLRPALKEFLEEFGVYIRRLLIQQTKDSADKMDVVGFVEYVKLCLHHVPSLEGLKIIGTCPLEFEQSEMDRIQKAVLRNECLSRSPNLKKLTSLQVDFSHVDLKANKSGIILKSQTVPYMDEIFHDIMIKPFYETRLKHLQLVGMLSKDISLKMCSLKELSLNVTKYGLKRMLNGKWLEASTVEKLNLSIKSTEVELFDILRIFPSVRYLKLERSCVSVNDIQLDCEESVLPLFPNNIHTLELEETNLSNHIFPAFPKVRFLTVGQVHSDFTERVTDDELEKLEKLYEKGELDFTTFYFLNGAGRTSSYCTGIWELLPALEVLKIQFQHHDCCEHHNLLKCEYTCVKGTKFECPFKNLVGTRIGYNRFYKRLSRLMPQFKYLRLV